MRMPCPLCGPRDRREFYYYGSDDYLKRPDPDAPMQAWDDHLHLRDNPAGPTRDLWYHETGCSAWIEVTRDTVTHAILSARLVGQAADASGGSISAKKKPRAKKGEASA
jgi:sarcosine oxidase subunit delta